MGVLLQKMAESETIYSHSTSEHIDICADTLSPKYYCNDSKFSDRYAWANSADPDQTAPSLIRVYTFCHSVCIVWTHYSMVEPHSSNFRVITTNFWVSEYLGNLRYIFHCYKMYTESTTLRLAKETVFINTFKPKLNKSSWKFVCKYSETTVEAY